MAISHAQCLITMFNYIFKIIGNADLIYLNIYNILNSYIPQEERIFFIRKLIEIESFSYNV